MDESGRDPTKMTANPGIRGVLVGAAVLVLLLLLEVVYFEAMSATCCLISFRIVAAIVLPSISCAMVAILDDGILTECEDVGRVHHQ